MRIRTTFIISVWFSFFASNTAGAYFQSARPLDQLSAEASVIVKVSIADLKTIEGSIDSSRLSFLATIVDVIKTDNLNTSESQVFEWFGLEAELSLWGLWPFTDQSLILFLNRDDLGQLEIMNDRHAIILVYPAKARETAKPAPYKRSLYEEFKVVAETNAEPLVKARYLSYMAAFAGPDELMDFEHFAVDDDLWVQLASAFAAGRIDPQPFRIENVVTILKRKSSQLQRREVSTFYELISDVRLAARCGAYGMDEAMTRSARAYLPIYRHFLDQAAIECVNTPLDCFGVLMSIDALAAVGTEDDIIRLWRFHNSTWNPARHDALEGLARILGKPTKRPMITSYQSGVALPDHVLEWEAEILDELQESLAARGLSR